MTKSKPIMLKCREGKLGVYKITVYCRFHDQTLMLGGQEVELSAAIPFTLLSVVLLSQREHSKYHNHNKLLHRLLLAILRTCFSFWC